MEGKGKGKGGESGGGGWLCPCKDCSPILSGCGEFRTALEGELCCNCCL
jgi:hypothetical protein